MMSTYPEVRAAVAAQRDRDLLLDILELDGEDLIGLPLLERREEFERAIRRSGPDRAMARVFPGGVQAGQGSVARGELLDFA